MKKRILCMLMTTILLLSCFTFAVSAETITDSNGTCAWSFDTETGALSVTGTGDFNLEIPYKIINKIKTVVIGEGITSIGNGSFEGSRFLTNVTFPSTLKSIGVNAFNYCYGLSEVVLPEGLETIDEMSFANTSIETLNIPSTLISLNPTAFSNVTFKSITVAQGNTVYKAIDNGLYSADGKIFYMFANKSNATSYTIADGTERIERNAFYDNNSLETIVIPNSVITIDNNAFCYMHKLKEVNIPASVQTINNNSFLMLYSVTEFNVASENNNYKSVDGVLFTKDGKELIAYPTANTRETYTVPAEVEKVASSAFTNATFKEINFAGTSISTLWNTFSSNPNLEKIVLPEGLTAGGNYYGCDNLKEIYIPSTLSSFAFDFLLYIGNVNIIINEQNPYLKCIDGVFYALDGGVPTSLKFYPAFLTSVSYTMPDTVTSIDIYIDNEYLETLNLGKALSSIQSLYLPNIKTLTIAAGNENFTVENNTLYSADKTSLYLSAAGKTQTTFTIPDSVEYVEWNSFFNSDKLETLNIGKSVGYIGSSEGCYALKAINVASENEYLFTKDNVLYSTTNELIWYPQGKTDETFAIPEGIVDMYDLSDNPYLKKVIFSSTLEYVDGYFANNLPNLEEVVVDENNEYYCSIDGVVYDKDKTELVAYPIGKKLVTFNIPEGVNYISYIAFNNSKYLKKVYVPKSIISLNSDTFFDTQITIHYAGTKEEWDKTFYNYELFEFNTVYNASPITEFVISDSTKTFTDVKAGSWYTEYVDFAVSAGLFNGMSETTFEPNTNMNRAMFVTVLARMSGSDINNADMSKISAFTDVKENNWFAKYVAFAVSNNIVNGVTATTFCPNDSITREQMCTMIVRFANTFNVNLMQNIDKVTFEDDAKIKNYAKEAVYICQQAGIVNGMTTTTFEPQGKATRAQVAKVLSVFWQSV